MILYNKINFKGLYCTCRHWDKKQILCVGGRKKYLAQTKNPEFGKPPLEWRAIPDAILPPLEAHSGYCGALCMSANY